MNTTRPTRVANFVASGAIGGRRIVKLSDEQTALLAGAATDKAVGISDKPGAADTERCDVVLSGGAELILGGTVVVGDLIMSDAAGAGVVAAAAAGSNVRTIGIALAAGVSGDFIPVEVCIGSFQG